MAPPGDSGAGAAAAASASRGRSLRGRCVQTPFGWGLCTRDEAEELHVQVALDWRLADYRRATCAVRRQDIRASSFCAVGECVLTSFGTGVVLCFRPEDGVHSVQLWGPLGRGRHTAYLREEALLAVLPAATGLAVETPYGRGICRGVRLATAAVRVAAAGAKSSAADRRVADGECFVDIDFAWARSAVLRGKDVQSPAAMTLPLISRFLQRAADLVRIHSGTLTRLRDALGGLGLERLQERLTARTSDVVDAASKLWDEWSSKDAKVMVDSFKLKADEVMADPQMKQAIKAGIARLNKLVCGAHGFDGVWVGEDQKPRCSIDDAVMSWHWGHQSDLEVEGEDEVSTDLGGEVCKGRLQPDGTLLWTDGDRWIRAGPVPGHADGDNAGAGEADVADIKLVEKSLEDLRRIMSTGGEGVFDGEVENALSSLSRIASSDDEVQRILAELKVRRDSLLELRGRVLDTKAGQVFQEASVRLHEKLARLHDAAINPQLERVQQRSKRFITRLTTDRRVKNTASELFSIARERFTAKFDQGSLESWVEAVKERVVNEYASHRAMLAESLGGLDLQHIDISRLVANPWDPVALERQLERSLVQAVTLAGLETGSGAELLDRFEDRNVVSRIPAVQRTYQGVLTLLSEMGIDVPVPMRKLLEAQAAGHQSLDAWQDAVLGTLDDASVAEGAEAWIKRGEAVLSQAEAWKQNETIARVMQHLESEDIERELLARLHGLDAKAMISEAESALTSLEAREQLLSHLKDTCLDFILKILPAIHIEKATGNDNGVDWEINNISFSDFSFRKENVHIALGDPSDAAQDLLRVSAWDISAHFRDLKVSVQQTSFPNLKAECRAEARAERMSVAFAFKLVPTGENSAGSKPQATTASANPFGALVAGWAPTLSAATTGRSPCPASPAPAAGAGAGAAAAGGTPAPTNAAAPAVMMSSRSVHMDSLELSISDNDMAFFVNALTFLFADILKAYACQKIASHIDEHVGTLVQGLNTVLATCTPYLAKLGFQLPSLKGSRGVAALEDAGAEETVDHAIQAWSACAVPRLRGRGGGRVQGLPEEIDWPDPGRTFAVRA